MTAKPILVCGGAGYIGSHMCKHLHRNGFLPITFDNLSTGHRWTVKWGPMHEGDLLNLTDLSAVFAKFDIHAVMHFAARSLVGESMQHPEIYFRNNVTGTLNLLEAMRDAGVGRLVFSSTAAVYGNPERIPIDEEHPTRPISPYGWSKLMAERQIAEFCRAYDFRAACLRYFNAAGADSDGEIGEAHQPETHLIPNILLAALDQSRGPVKLFGNDYPTADGTCVRDYIHVEDLCEAHLRALRYINIHPGSHVFNLGSGSGYSVAEVLQSCREACGGEPEVTYAARREGDPAMLVASNGKARALIAWEPVRTLRDIIGHAKTWHETVK